VFETRIRKKVVVDDVQFEFRLGKGMAAQNGEILDTEGPWK